MIRAVFCSNEKYDFFYQLKIVHESLEFIAESYKSIKHSISNYSFSLAFLSRKYSRAHGSL